MMISQTSRFTTECRKPAYIVDFDVAVDQATLLKQQLLLPQLWGQFIGGGGGGVCWEKEERKKESERDRIWPHLHKSNIR